MTSQSSSLNRLLTGFFAILLAMQVLYLLVGFASIPLYYHRVTTQAIPSVVYYGQVQISNQLVAEMAAERGLSLTRYATYRIIVNTAAALIPLVQAGTVIAYVAPDLAIRLNLPNWGESAFTAPVLLNFVIILACQVYRYRRVL